MLIGLTLSLSDIGRDYFFWNEGVSIQCAKLNSIDLFHPGKELTKACSYDHQPLYSLITKVIYEIHPEIDPFIYRLPAAIFYTLSLVVFTLLLLSHRVEKSLIPIATLVLATLPFIMFETLQVRLYGLYLLTSLLSFLLVRMYEEKRIKFKWLFLTYLIAYLNFFLSLLLIFTQLIYLRRKNLLKPSKELYSFIFFSALLLIKLPYILWWRLEQRVGDDFWNNSYALKLFFIDPFFTSKPILPNTILTGCLLLFMSISFFKYQWRDQYEKYMYRFLMIFPFIFFFLLHFGFQANEITSRYFIYIWPILLLCGFIKLSEIKNKFRTPIVYGIFIIFSILNFQHNRSRPFDRQGLAPPKVNLELSQFAMREQTSSSKPLLVTSNDSYYFENYALPYMQDIPGRTKFIREENLTPENLPEVIYYVTFYYQVARDYMYYHLRTNKPFMLERYQESNVLWRNEIGFPFLEIRKLTLKQQSPVK